MRIRYFGEGKIGDHVLNARNLALKDAAVSGRPVDVFLDCGDIFSPTKCLLSAGRWRIDRAVYMRHPSERRRVYSFSLSPIDSEIAKVLRLMFGSRGCDEGFERALKRFAPARAALYREYPQVLRARDSIAGEVGEYFAIRFYNGANPVLPLIRLRSSFKDLDAVQIKTGKRFAIKTIGRFPGMTSNIWSKAIDRAIDFFLVTYLDGLSLSPKFLLVISSKVAVRYGLLLRVRRSS